MSNLIICYGPEVTTPPGTLQYSSVENDYSDWLLFKQGQLLQGVECHIYLYCFTFDDINLNRAFVIIVLFPKKYSNKKACANDIDKRNA